MALYDNKMGYSERLIHSFMCKQLITVKKHELWFEFAGQPLRFSLQEFHAVTGLKCTKEANVDFGKWEGDKGFWSKLLNRGGKISLQSISLKHLQECHKWSHVDRIRLIYLSVIASLLMAQDEKIDISHKYIKLVMDIEKLRMYPWGLESFDALVDLIITSRKKLKNKKSYVLNGFTYAFQIWIMEGIPEFGEMLGKKKNPEFIGPLCGNWGGAAKISYKDITRLEPLFRSHCTLHPCLSACRDQEVLLDAAFMRDNEVTDERVDHMFDLITKRHKWSTSMWDFDESVVTFLQEGGDIVTKMSAEDVADGTNAVTSPDGGESSVTGSKRTRSKIADHGAETRKKKLLCKRAAEAQGSVNEGMKSFFEGLIHSSFTALEEKLEKKIESQVQASFSALEEKMEKKMESEIKASLSALEGKMENKIESEIKLLKEAMEKGNRQSSKGKEPASSKAKVSKIK